MADGILECRDKAVVGRADRAFHGTTYVPLVLQYDPRYEQQQHGVNSYKHNTN